MLGPEMVNYAIRPTPLFSDGVPSLKLLDPVPKELGLLNHQTIRTVVEVDKSGQFFFFNQRRFELPDTFKTIQGRTVSFLVRFTQGGAILVPLTPGLLAPSVSPGMVAANKVDTYQSAQLASILGQLRHAIESAPREGASALAGLKEWVRTTDLSSPPVLSAEVIKNFLLNNGVLASDSKNPLAKLLLVLIRSDDGLGKNIRSRVRELFESLVLRQEVSTRALQQGQLLFESIGSVNQIPFNMIVALKERAHSDKDSSPQDARPYWQVDFYSEVNPDDRIWVSLTLMKEVGVRVSIWLTNKSLHTVATQVRGDLQRELESAGLRSIEITLYDGAKDALYDRVPPNKTVEKPLDFKV